MLPNLVIELNDEECTSLCDHLCSSQMLQSPCTALEARYAGSKLRLNLPAQPSKAAGTTNWAKLNCKALTSQVT